MKKFLLGFVILSLFGLSRDFFPARPAMAHQPHDEIVAIAISPDYANDKTIFAATGLLSVTLGVKVMLKSVDGGLSWRVVPHFPSYTIQDLQLSPDYADDQTVFAASVKGLFKSTDGGDHWQDLHLAVPVLERVGISPNFAVDQTLLGVDKEGQLWRSLDGGQNWMNLPLPTVVKHESIISSAVTFSPAYAIDQTIFAVVAGVGIFRTTDAGTSWESIGNELTSWEITSLVTTPFFAQFPRLYAATHGGGVYRSDDAGNSWVAINTGITDLNLTDLVLSPVFTLDQTLFIATDSGQAYKSEDGGNSWQLLPDIPRELNWQTEIHYRQLLLSPAFAIDQTLFLATFEGLWLSRTAGQNWRASEILPTYLARSITVSPNYANDQTVFVSTYGGGMIRTIDGGQNWTTHTTGLSNGYPDATTISPNYANEPTLFAGTVWGLWRSTNAGELWEETNMLNTSVFVRSAATSPAFATDQTLALGSDNAETYNPPYLTYNGETYSSNGLFLSHDGGDNWIPTQVNGVGVHSIAFSPQFATDQTVFAGSLYGGSPYVGGIYRSQDGGATWFWLGLFDLAANCCISRITVSPQYATDQTVFMIRANGNSLQRGFYKSVNGGLSWIHTPNSNNITLLDIAVSPNYSIDQTIFVATLEEGILVSTNGGDSFQPTGLTEAYVTAVDISPNYENDQTIYAGTYKGIFKTEDGGTIWQPLTNHTRYEEVAPNFQNHGNWVYRPVLNSSAGKVLVSLMSQSLLDFTFVGQSLTVLGNKGPNFGIANFYLDGQLIEQKDLYDPVSLVQTPLFTLSNISEGSHRLSIVNTGLKNPASTSHLVAVDAIDVWFVVDGSD